jgi:MoaA/NifB/PqqE/SkfB family radical SAM enzyme
MTMRAARFAAGTLTTAALVRLGRMTNRTIVLPLLIFFPTGRCNSRCVSCDWWKRSGADDLTVEEIRAIADEFPSLGTRVVVFSGGEPLLRPEVFEAAAIFRARGATLHLLTSGVLLERFAERVAEHFARVCVSLDASTPALYAQIRGVDALDTVSRGISRVRRAAPDIPVVARATLHRANFRELPRLIERAHALGLHGISFLPADVSSLGFGRDAAPDASALALDAPEIAEFESIVDRAIAVYAHDFESGFVAEAPDKLRRLPRYYAALAGAEPFPEVSCHAPWISAVVEANGAVRPCFFHAAVGSVREDSLEAIVTRNLRAFRRSLDVGADPVCVRCVCSLKTSWRSAPWS